MAQRQHDGTCVVCLRPRRLNSREMCPSCYVAHMQKTAGCGSCGHVKKIQARGLCRACYLAQPDVRERKNAARRTAYATDVAVREARRAERAAEASKPHSVKRKRAYDRWYNYGLAPEQYDALMTFQSGACVVCRQTLDTGEAAPKDRRPHVDHCHRTGRVRGILCGACNRGLGCFEDSSERLQAAVRYLMS